MSLRNTVTFIPDIHGDPVALRQALIQSGHAKRIRSGLKFHDEGQIVLTGDLTDHGERNLEVLDTILQIQEQVRSAVLCGNHDVWLQQALNHPEDPDFVYSWLSSDNGGYTVLREVAKKFNLTLKNPTYSYPVLSDDAFQERLWTDLQDRHNMKHIDFPAAYEKTRELLDGKYKSIYANMKVTHRFGPILASHAMPDEAALLIGEKKSVEYLQQCHEEKNWDSLLEGEGALSRAIHSRFPLQISTARELLRQNIFAVVHGHMMVPHGRQSQVMQNGVAVINGDVGMSRAYSESPATYGFVQWDTDTGLLRAESNVGPKQVMGKIAPNGYEPISIPDDSESLRIEHETLLEKLKNEIRAGGNPLDLI